MTPGLPILQFGTSRFLQAHVDLFVSDALDTGEALGGITVVQTTAQPASTARRAALAADGGFEVRVRGRAAGVTVDETRTCRSVRAALHADTDWAAIRADVRGGAVRVIVSNTGDAGWRDDPADGAASLRPDAASPRGFPAKLLVLLHGRWRVAAAAPLTVLPCELVARNGDTLRGIVCDLARQWVQPPAFIDWLGQHVVWGNSLVDRIVSEALEPAGAVAEPYALWAIERQPRLVLPCRHPALVLTDDLGRHERLKLFLLNLGHTCLADLWLQADAPPDATVLQAMRFAPMREAVEATWADEVLPVFDALGQGDEARDYLATVRDRLLNPFLAHRLADIAQNHRQKKQRRLQPVVALAQQHAPGLRQPRLQAALAGLA